MSNNGPNVLLVGGDQWGEGELFRNQGWNVILDHKKADFICFTGGADISPRFYGAEQHPYTSVSPRRDDFEEMWYEMTKGKRMLGICRGGQLLNALSGGSMYQHVDRHNRTHTSIDVETGNEFLFSSVHHQMMIPGEGAKLLAVAPGQSTFRETDKEKFAGHAEDVEALFYEKTSAFCFQPHPEWGPASCTEYFFRKIDQLYS